VERTVTSSGVAWIFAELIEGNKLSDEQWLPIVAECSTLAGHVVNPPFHFHVPPAEELLADEDEEDEDDDEQEAN